LVTASLVLRNPWARLSKKLFSCLYNNSVIFDHMQVACRQLGFLGAKRYYRHPGGTGYTWLNEVNCQGTEMSLVECNYRTTYFYCGKSHRERTQSDITIYGFIHGSVVFFELTSIRELKQTTTATTTRTPRNKILMSRTTVVQVRNKSLDIFLPSSAKQQRKMTKVWLF